LEHIVKADPDMGLEEHGDQTQDQPEQEDFEKEGIEP
jgi:hypothetical protein